MTETPRNTICFLPSGFIKQPDGQKGGLDSIYPIGSLYWSSNSTDPSQLFGGTWTAITDKFIYAKGTKAVNATGGKETVELLADNMPAHYHTTTSYAVPYNGAYGSGYTVPTLDSGTPIGSTTGYAGGGGMPAGHSIAHENMPPYIVKYCWERTA